MNYIGKVFILGVFFSVSSVLKGQNGALMPDVYDQFFQNYYLINPANTDTSEIIINMGHKSQLGIFRGVRQTYFDANFRIKSKNPNAGHYVGVQLFNNSEGDFFSKNRAYGRYAFDIRITDAYFLSAGLSFGMVSYAFKATQSSAGGSDFTYDGSLGLWLVGRKLKVGTSMQQVFQKTLAPIGQTFELKRQYNVNASYTCFINPYIELTTHVWYKYQQSYKNDFQLAAMVTLQNLIEFGGNYKYQKGVVLIGGLKDVRIGTSRICIAMSYSTGILNTIARGDNAVEIFLKYSK
jgi:type IX secretion system PorP/SprF family membrane protein